MSKNLHERHGKRKVAACHGIVNVAYYRKGDHAIDQFNTRLSMTWRTPLVKVISRTAIHGVLIPEWLIPTQFASRRTVKTWLSKVNRWSPSIKPAVNHVPRTTWRLNISDRWSFDQTERFKKKLFWVKKEGEALLPVNLDGLEPTSKASSTGPSAGRNAVNDTDSKEKHLWLLVGIFVFWQKAIAKQNYCS